MTKNQEFEFIKEYIGDETLRDNATVCHQLRALWTAYCLHHDLDVDTAEYDADMRNLWGYIAGANDYLHDSCGGDGFDAFDNFMCELMV